MNRYALSLSCWVLLGVVSIAGLVWAQDSVADIEFLEFLANWSEEEQYWLEAELDAFEQTTCHSEEAKKIDQTGVESCQESQVNEGSEP